ncbi:14568_t:CDS:1, partial [Racocetra fulgida]
YNVIDECHQNKINDKINNFLADNHQEDINIGYADATRNHGCCYENRFETKRKVIIDLKFDDHTLLKNKRPKNDLGDCSVEITSEKNN